MLKTNTIILSILFSTNLILAQETQFNLEKEKNTLNQNIFTHYDKDKNKALSLEEFSLLSKELKNKQLNKMMNDLWERCTNKDNFIALDKVLSEAEIIKSQPKCYLTKMEFQDMDKDHDHKVSREELVTFYTDAMSHKGMISPDGMKKRNEFPDLLMACDTNKDDKLDLIEATSRKCSLNSDTFIEMDKDKNSFLDKSELVQMNQRKEDPKINLNDIKHLPPEMHISMIFSICDTNQNIKLTTQEAVECKLDMSIFTKYDYDKSNTIEENDIDKVYIAAEFKRLDTNANNAIDLKELNSSYLLSF